MRVLLAALVVVLMTALPGVPEAFGFEEASGGASLEASAPPQQQMQGESELPWLFAVYIITWGAFFGYIFFVSRRQREMRREIDALRRAMADRERREREARTEQQGQSR